MYECHEPDIHEYSQLHPGQSVVEIHAHEDSTDDDEADEAHEDFEEHMELRNKVSAMVDEKLEQNDKDCHQVERCTVGHLSAQLAKFSLQFAKG